MRVLVIEDYEPIRSAVVQAITEDGFAVDSAEDGRDGMWLAKSATAAHAGVVVNGA